MISTKISSAKISSSKVSSLKVSESRYKQCGVTPHFHTGKIYWKKYRQKINLDMINSEKLFDRSADHK